MVDEQAGATSQRLLEVGVALSEDRSGVDSGLQGVVRPCDPLLGVRVEIVRGGEERDDPVEPVNTEPDDLFLPAHAAMMGGEATRTLADRQTVANDPGEVSRRDPCRPLPSHPCPPISERAWGESAGVDARSLADTAPPMRRAAMAIGATS